eukprot:TRINITY_DN13586_c0_g1_i1.p1 TRINITY_DN13586_c0_g1~~TRINITY_DN13586_c0_g1_i1.p1  ORF type:complete len:142 (+),score=23.99 TRINITY_DN13586_c0_g1_i1:649-1074(+)
MLFWESGCGGLGEDGDSLWKSVLVAKHGVLRNGWDIQRLNYCASRLWRGVASTKEAFLRNIKSELDPGIRFSSGSIFELETGHWRKHFLTYSSEPEIVTWWCLATWLEMAVNFCGLWCPLFRRNLMELKENHLFCLMELLS